MLLKLSGQCRTQCLLPSRDHVEVMLDWMTACNAMAAFNKAAVLHIAMLPCVCDEGDQ